ncbi:MAG: hypothetical protein FJ139_00105 [Deltaproteobacteria bacterium]|nr:hypothetical protein [Deltaproteobacteria bacterium]
MFLFKKIVAPLFYPLSLILGMLTLGLILIWFTKKQKAGKIIVTMGTIMLCCLSYNFLPDLLLESLEQRFPPFATQDNIGTSRLDLTHSVKWIVLLGGGHTLDPKLPVTSQLSEESLVRLAEAIRIQRIIPGSKIVLSGGAVYEKRAEAETLSSMAVMLHVRPEDIVLDTVSRDTEEQALTIRNIVGKNQFVLVTSASHMPRSMALLGKLGLSPIPAPTGHLIKQKQAVTPDEFYPSYMGLLKTQKACHEYLGLLWSRIRDKA